MRAPRGMRIAPALALAAAVGCFERSEPRVLPELAIELHTPAVEVELGRPFPLELVRTFSRGMDPEPFPDERLAPLAVRRIDTRRATRGHATIETIRYEARAFDLGRIEVPAPEILARGPGRHAGSSARGEPLELTVRSTLPAGDPGVPELPSGPLPEPSGSLRPLVLGAAVALLVAFLAFYLRPRRRTEDPARPAAARPARDPDEQAVARLQRLSGLDPSSPAEIEAFHVELADALRTWLELRFELAATRRTREELLADPATGGALGSARRGRLVEILESCDRVKFARSAPSREERARSVAAAIELVRAGGGMRAASTHPPAVGERAPGGRATDSPSTGGPATGVRSPGERAP